MIPQDVLRVLAEQYRLTKAEQDILFPAVRGVPIAQIAGQLSISQNAVRKRLSEIYLKFGISESGSGRTGPGKLNELRQFLISQYQSRTIHRVVLCEFGIGGRQFVEKLQNTIFSYPQIEIWTPQVDSVEVQSWVCEIENSLENSEIVLGCITPGAEQLSWINFQIGFLAGRSRNFKLIRFYEELSGPMKKIPSIDGTNPDEVTNLLERITHADAKQIRKWVDFQFVHLKDMFESLKHPFVNTENINKIVKKTDELKNKVENELIKNPYFENACFQSIVFVSIADVVRRVTAIRSTCTIPANLYPRYLISLQTNYDAQVEAIAIINYRENFWSEEVGRRIWETADPNSKRIFIFMKTEDFDRNFEMLLEHGAKYNVYAMSYELLAREFKGYANDFAILRISDSEVLAKYGLSRTYQKDIYFSPNQKEIESHRKMFKAILNSAVSIQSALEAISREVDTSKILPIKKFEFREFRKLDEIREKVRTSVCESIFKRTDINTSTEVVQKPEQIR